LLPYKERTNILSCPGSERLYSFSENSICILKRDDIPEEDFTDYSYSVIEEQVIEQNEGIDTEDRIKKLVCLLQQ
jgi:hypothetical protein